MITSLRLQNFQGHKESIAELVDGVNIFVGLSDSGKSAIIRALRWIATNKPSGDSFRSYWGGETGASVCLGEVEIARTKTDTINRYEVHAPDGESVFSSFGQAVPEAVLAKLNIDQDISIQAQFDPPFLISQSSGEIARALNKSIGLEDIDSTISQVEKKKRSIYSSITTQTDLIKENTAQLEKLLYLDSAEEQLCKLEKTEKKIEGDKQKSNKLNSLCKQTQETFELYDMTMDKLTAIQKQIKPLEALASRQEELRVKNNEHKKLKQLLNETIKGEKEKNAAMEEIATISQLFVILEKLIKKTEALTKIIHRKERIDLLLSRHFDFTNRRELIVKLLEEVQEKIKQETPEVCPFCGAKVGTV